MSYEHILLGNMLITKLYIRYVCFSFQVGYICGAIKLLRAQRQKPDAITYMSLAYLAKLKKHLFTNDYVINGLCSLLKRDTGPTSFKSLPIKTNPILYYLVINIFITVFQDTRRWPEMFIKVSIQRKLLKKIYFSSF